MELLENISKNIPALTFLGALVAGIWPAIQYLINKRAENRKHRFETYHDLIKRLVVGDTDDGPVWIDRQIAIAYELRSFKEYYPVTQRILGGLQQQWQKNINVGTARLLAEIALTMTYIDGKKCTFAFWRPKY